MDGEAPRNRTSRGIIELGRRYAREDGFRLPQGHTVPMGWLTANHGTGRSDVDVTKTIPISERWPDLDEEP